MARGMKKRSKKKNGKMFNMVAKPKKGKKAKKKK